MKDYETIKIWKETKKRLKVYAVENDMTLTQAIENLLDLDMLAKSNLDSKIEVGDLNK